MSDIISALAVLRPGLLAVVVALLCVASLNDIAVRTIPDIASFGVVVIGVALRLIDGTLFSGTCRVRCRVRARSAVLAVRLAGWRRRQAAGRMCLAGDACPGATARAGNRPGRRRARLPLPRAGAVTSLCEHACPCRAVATRSSFECGARSGGGPDVAGLCPMAAQSPPAQCSRCSRIDTKMLARIALLVLMAVGLAGFGAVAWISLHPSNPAPRPPTDPRRRVKKCQSWSPPGRCAPEAC